MAVKQISVFLENKTGQLSGLTKVLAEAGVDILALNVAETDDYGIVRLIVDSPQKAVELFTASGFVCNLSEVIVLAVPDVPGGLAGVLDAPSGSSFDVEYMYSLFPSRAGTAFIAVRTDNTREVESVFTRSGVKTMNSEELGIK